MIKNIAILLIAALLWSCGSSTPTNTINVKNPQELADAINNAKAGDEIIMSNGIWKDLQIEFGGKGTKDNPIVIRAEENGKVSVEGKSFFKLGGEYLMIKGLHFKNGYSPSEAIIEFMIKKDSIANNCRVTECVFDGFSKPNRHMQDHWIRFWGRNNALDHCYIGGKFNQGPTVKVFLKGNEHIKNFHKIANNHFGPRPRKGGPKSETIQIGASFTSMTPSHTIIENNYFEKCNGEVEIISNKSNNCEIRNNIFFECEGSVVLRHGNYCIVDGNFFIGNDNSDFYGGIRVINTGHWITNNYFYKINGNEFRAPLAIMNGIPKSPLNRYNQVTDAVVAHNTWVDCKTPWHFSVGVNTDKKDVLPKSEIRSARPVRTIIANNIAYASDDRGSLIKAYDKVDGIEFKKNIVINYNDSLKYDGIVKASLEFSEVEAWLFAPKSNPENILSDVYNGFEFENIINDIAGKSRKGSNEIGALLSAVKTEKKIIEKSNYGPVWYTKEASATQAEIIQATTSADLIAALEKANDGDIVELDGKFEVSESLAIRKKITIKSKDNTNKAEIVYSGKEEAPAFEMHPKGHLVLEGVKVSGNGNSDAIAPLSENMYDIYNISITESEISGFNRLLFGYKSTMGDSIIFTKSSIKDCNYGLELAAETDDKGDYNAEVVTIDDCQFENISNSVVDFYRGGYDESTIGGCLTVKNSSFKNCGGSEKSKILIKTYGIINVGLFSNEFISNPVKHIAILWGEKNNKHFDNVVKQSGEILVEQHLKQKLVY